MEEWPGKDHGRSYYEQKSGGCVLQPQNATGNQLAKPHSILLNSTDNKYALYTGTKEEMEKLLENELERLEDLERENILPMI